MNHSSSIHLLEQLRSGFPDIGGGYAAQLAGVADQIAIAESLGYLRSGGIDSSLQDRLSATGYPDSLLGSSVGALSLAQAHALYEEESRARAIASYRGSFASPHLVASAIEAERRLSSDLSVAHLIQQEEEDRRRAVALASLGSSFADVQRIAVLAEAASISSVLEQFRTPSVELALKLAALHSYTSWPEATLASAFGRASSVADYIEQTARIERSRLCAGWEMLLVDARSATSVRQYGQLLTAAGLGLPRWPRLLTIREKRRQLRARLSENREPQHFREAKSLVHRYEWTLRDVLEEAMAREYGQEWAQERLPLCDCKGLLGRWVNRGGKVLDHADYKHYELIMCNPDHFEAASSAGFKDPEVLKQLLSEAGRLRAASHHGGAFTPEDLVSLRLTWKALEKGLAGMVGDFDFDG